jgi:4-hydroxybenzoate polyprenyltransferase
MKFRESLQRIVTISRPAFWINTLGPAFLGMWSTGQLWDHRFAMILLWLTLPFNALIYGVNDVFDYEIDQKTARKGGWEGAVLHRNERRLTILMVLLLNLPFLAYFVWQLPVLALIAVLAYTVIFVAYSMPPLRFKARPLIDSLSNAAYALPVWIVPLALEKSPHLWLGLALMTWSVAKHCYDAIQDIDVDREHGLATTPVFLGIKGALVFCLFFWLIASVCLYQLSPLVAYLNLAYVAVLLIPVILSPSAATAHRYYRMSVAFPYVVGTVGGVQLALAVALGAWP